LLLNHSLSASFGLNKERTHTVWIFAPPALTCKTLIWFGLETWQFVICLLPIGYQLEVISPRRRLVLLVKAEHGKTLKC
jgi:hypothetical protein